jgi:hypothetical protein
MRRNYLQSMARCLRTGETSPTRPTSPLFVVDIIIIIIIIICTAVFDWYENIFSVYYYFWARIAYLTLTMQVRTIKFEL